MYLKKVTAILLSFCLTFSAVHAERIWDYDDGSSQMPTHSIEYPPLDIYGEYFEGDAPYDGPNYNHLFENYEHRTELNIYRMERNLNRISQIDFSRYRSNKVRNEIHRELEKRFPGQVATDRNGRFYIKEPNHGFGFSSNGSYYGHFENGKKDGYGKLTTSKGYYKGNWKADQKSGFGEELINDSLYIGQFAHNRRHGYGNVRTKNFTYFGDYSLGFMSGSGVLKRIAPEDQAFEYQGEMKKDRPNGLGTLEDKKYVQSGYFKDGWLDFDRSYLEMHKESDTVIQESSFGQYGTKAVVKKDGEVELSLDKLNYGDLSTVKIKKDQSLEVSWAHQKVDITKNGQAKIGDQPIGQRDFEDLLSDQVQSLSKHSSLMRSKSDIASKLFYFGKDSTAHAEFFDSLQYLAKVQTQNLKNFPRDHERLQRMVNDAYSHMSFSMGIRHNPVTLSLDNHGEINRINYINEQKILGKKELVNNFHQYLQDLHPSKYASAVENSLKSSWGRFGSYSYRSGTNAISVGRATFNPLKGYRDDLLMIQDQYSSEEFLSTYKEILSGMEDSPRDALRLSVENFRRSKPYQKEELQRIFKGFGKKIPPHLLSFKELSERERSTVEQYSNLDPQVLANIERENYALSKQMKGYLDNYQDIELPDDIGDLTEQVRAKQNIYSTALSVQEIQTTTPSTSILKNMALKITRELYHGVGSKDELIAMSNLARKFTDLATQYTPGISGVRDIYEAISGHDFFSGEELGTNERLMKSAFGALELATLGLVSSFGKKAIMEGLEKAAPILHRMMNTMSISKIIDLEKIKNYTGKVLEVIYDLNKSESLHKLKDRLGSLQKLGLSKADDIDDLAKVAKTSAGNNADLVAKNIDDYADAARLGAGPKIPAHQAINFKNSKHFNRKLVQPENFNRYHGVHNRTGKKFIYTTKIDYADEKSLRDGAAILDEWGVTITQKTKFEAPAGEWVTEGLAAAQRGGTGEIRPGGDYQALFTMPDIPRNWIRNTTEAFP